MKQSNKKEQIDLSKLDSREEGFIETPLDNNPETATFNRIFESMLKMLPPGIEEFDVWFGGGCYARRFLDEKISDIDFFSRSRDELARLTKFLRNNGFQVYFANHNAIKGYIDTERYGRINIDVVKITFEDEISTIRNFDFSVTKIMTNPHTRIAYYFESAFIDILQKRLVLPHGVVSPLSTLKRLQKYIKRGFTACDGTLLTLSKAISEVDFTDPKQNMMEFYPDGRPAVPMWD